MFGYHFELSFKLVFAALLFFWSVLCVCEVCLFRYGSLSLSFSVFLSTSKKTTKAGESKSPDNEQKKRLDLGRPSPPKKERKAKKRKEKRTVCIAHLLTRHLPKIFKP